MYCPYCMNTIALGEKYCKVCGKNPTSYKGESHYIPCGYVLNERYDMGSVLNEGELGLVYIAVDRKSGHKVFIKEYFPMNDAYRDLDDGMVIKCCIGSEGTFEKKKEKFVSISSSLIRRDTIAKMLYDREYFTLNHSAYLMMDFLADTMLGQLIEQNRLDEAIEVYKQLWKNEEKEIIGNNSEKKKFIMSVKSVGKRFKEMSLKAKVGVIISEVAALLLLIVAIIVVTHEHSYGEWIITKEATCTTDGERKRVCACGEEEVEGIVAVGHTVVIDEAVEATCVTDGLTQGSHCSICNEILTAQEIIEKTGHIVEVDKAVEATCTESGLTEGTHCSVCNEVIMKQQIVKVLGHSISEGSCVRCGDGASENLKYVLKEDDTYELSKIGTCTDTKIVIPSIYNGKAVTSIGAQAFSDCDKITSVTIPSSITSIEIGAFSGCSSLKTVTLSSNITSIGKEAFYKCTSLTDVTIPSKIETIGTYAFSECDNLTKITVPSSVEDLGSYVFAECNSLKTVTISEGVKTIGAGTFYNCVSLTNVTIPSSVTKIKESAFEDCKSLTKVVIPISVTKIEKNAFANCNSLKVYAEAESKPSGWNSAWKTYRVKVTWGYEA